ncbi:hypothetical protein ABIE44_003592 [Marmoricola sp. OAE513]|uniref:hypothetical protein n=1 Tax=Marmoricola sp. OAE513 TaxID=2817894 RepID=UPI001AE754F8
MDTRNSRTTRTTIAVWGSSALAAVVLVLGVNGTLASWTSAVIANDTNTAATSAAVILREVGPGPQTCFSSSGAGNSYTCSTINKYGGTASPLAPGTNQTTDVVFTNVGSASASTFVLGTGSCSQTPTAGSGTPAAANVCTSGDLTVAVSCSDGATYASGSAWADLVHAASAPGSTPATLTHTATIAAGASFTCRFTVAVTAGASVLAQGVTVSQPLTWTLNV